MIKLHATRHAQLRARQRIHWHGRTLERMLERVVYAGLAPDDCSGALRGYLCQLGEPREAILRIYGEHLYVFTRGTADSLSLLTVYGLPAELRGKARRARADWHALAA